MTKNFELGQTVYLEHPQLHIRPNTIIDAKIIKISEIKIRMTYYEDHYKHLNREAIRREYEVRLSPSGSLIEVKEEEIYSDVNILREKVKEKILSQKQKLQKEIDNLLVAIDI